MTPTPHTADATTARAEILVLVHPGSACGSANSNLGKSEANAVRDLLAIELDQWHGGLIVIDGELSDELPSYPYLKNAIEGALERAQKRSFVSVREDGNDPEQVEVIKNIVAQLGDVGTSAQYTVTGAWYHPEDSGGCVGSVIDALREVGCEASVADSAVSLTSDEDRDEELEDESGPSW